MSLMLETMNKLGVQTVVDHENDTIFVPRQDDLHIQKTIKGDIMTIRAQPRPMLPMDFIHICMVLGLKAEGSALFMNIGYEYSFFFIEELAKMKGRTVMADPHRVITFGPTEFKSANVVCSDVIQASYGLLLAALAANGTSTLNAITPLFRRFPNFVEQFNSLGGQLELTE